MRSAFESLARVGVPAFVVNQHGRIVSWNERAADFFRIPADSAIGSEWHTVIRTVRNPGCCALCSTRHLLRAGDIAAPVDVTLSIAGSYKDVVMVPMPGSMNADAGMGFLVLDQEPASTSSSSVHAPIPIRPRVRQLHDDRIIDELTPREREILTCVVDGHDARRIAAQLGITHATARNYVQRILTKLGVRNKAEAVSVALTYNLLAS